MRIKKRLLRVLGSRVYILKYLHHIGKPHHAQIPNTAAPPVRIVTFSEPAFSAGINQSEHEDTSRRSLSNRREDGRRFSAGLSHGIRVPVPQVMSGPLWTFSTDRSCQAHGRRSRQAFGLFLCPINDSQPIYAFKLPGIVRHQDQPVTPGVARDLEIVDSDRHPLPF